MQFDRLGDEWRRHLEREHDPANIERVTALIERLAKDFERKIWYRDLTETIGGVIAIVVFGYMATVMSSAIARLGCVINVIAFSYILVRLWRAGRVGHGAARPLTLTDGLKVERARIIRQIDLLKSIVWWYLSPAFIGCNLIFLGFSLSVLTPMDYPVGMLVSWALSFGYVIGTIILGRYYWSLNQRAVRDELEPILAEIESVSRNLQSDGGPDESPN